MKVMGKINVQNNNSLTFEFYFMIHRCSFAMLLLCYFFFSYRIKAVTTL